MTNNKDEGDKTPNRRPAKPPLPSWWEATMSEKPISVRDALTELIDLLGPSEYTYPITQSLVIAARDRIKELEERLANCDPGSGIDCGARIDTIEKMVVDASPEEAAALARVGIEGNDRVQYLYTLSSTSGEEVEGSALTLKELVQELPDVPWQLVDTDTWRGGEWCLKVTADYDTRNPHLGWQPRGLNKPELELLDTLLNPLYGSPEEID